MATGPQGVQGLQGTQGIQGIQGVTGARGPSGPQGPAGLQGPQGIQGPTGLQGLRGVEGPRGPEGGPTGPTGPAGSGGGGSALTMETLKSYSEAIVASNVSANSATPATVETYTVPSGMKGKTGFLTGYFYLKNQTAWASNMSLRYGFALDSSLIGTFNGLHPYYRHTSTTDSFAILGSNTVPGVGGFLSPVTIPVSVPIDASEFKATITNITLPLSTTQVGAVATTTFVGNGSIQSFTVPSDITSIRVYLWGAGGLTQNSVADQDPSVGQNGRGAAGGSGAYISGLVAVTPGQTLYLVIGRVTNSSSIITGNGGSGGAGNNPGGGFTGLFTADVSTMSRAEAAGYLVACAGGGGGSGVNSSAMVGGGGGVTAGQKAPDIGGTTGGSGGTQSAGGSAGGDLLFGGANAGFIGGGGGGGYYGGGACRFNNNPSSGGGGGSSYIGGLTSVVSEDGATPASQNPGVYADPGGASTMRSFFGNSAWYGASGYSGAAVITTQGTYPTYIGSEVSVTY